MKGGRAVELVQRIDQSASPGPAIRPFVSLAQALGRAVASSSMPYEMRR